MIEKIKNIYKSDEYYDEDLIYMTPNFRAIVNVLAEEIPEYKFALREDIKDDKRFLPTKAEEKASGWDVRAAMKDKQPLIIKPLQYNLIPLGCRGFCPDGWWYELRPRSSTFAKKHIHNLYGTIDETFEGELVFACQYIPDCNPPADNLVVNYADAIGQIIPIRRQEMKVIEWSNEEYDDNCKKRNGQRGAGGFGSTDKNEQPKLKCKNCNQTDLSRPRHKYCGDNKDKNNSHEWQTIKYGV
jgi:dUTP pyrophosphatase